METTPVKMCTKADIFWKFILESPILCIKFCRYDISSGTGTSINSRYELTNFIGVVKNDNEEFTLFNQECPNYSEINKCDTLAVKVADTEGKIFEYTFDGKNLPMIQCLSTYMLSDGNELKYYSNNLVCLDSVVRKYTGNRIVINLKNFSIDVSDTTKLLAGPEDEYYDEESGESKHLVILPV